MEAYSNWEAALGPLISAIDHYCDTFVALETAIATPQEYFPTTFSLEEVISNVSEKRTAIMRKIIEFHRVNIRLDRIHNRSRKQVSINALPPEILARIFTLACGSSCFSCSPLTVLGYSLRQRPKTLLALTRVCSDWREITINAPSLWSHIDIRRSRPGSNCMIPNASLWLERAQNMPLSVHISTYPPKEVISRTRLRKIFSRFDAVSSLAIGPTESSRWVTDTLTLWATVVQPGNLRALTIVGSDNAREKLRLRWTESTAGQDYPSAFLAPIRSLCLRRAYFNWDSPAYHGLVDLRLSGMRGEVCFSIGQIAGILAACPELHVLQLHSIAIGSGMRDSDESIPLNRLEVFDVTGMPPQSLELLLPIIAPGPGELSVRVDIQYREASIQALRSLFSRSNIVRLFLQSYTSQHADVAEQLTPLNNLRVLLVDPNFPTQTSREDIKLNAFLEYLSRTDSRFCPQLRTLYLINGKFSTEAVKKVVEARGIQRLRILSCYREEPEKDIDNWWQSFAPDMKRQLDVDLKALAEDWYEHMW